MFNFGKTATKTVAALLVTGALAGQANDASAQGFLDFNGCIGDKNLQFCFGTNSGRGYGNRPYHHRNNGYVEEAVEIDRVPYGYPCPPGTDIEAMISNRYPGTNGPTTICKEIRLVPAGR